MMKVMKMPLTDVHERCNLALSDLVTLNDVNQFKTQRKAIDAKLA